MFASRECSRYQRQFLQLLVRNKSGGQSASTEIIFKNNSSDSNSKQRQKLSIATTLAHAGLQRKDGYNNNNDPLCPPLHLATTYERPASGVYPEDGYIYARMGNPTRRLLEESLAALEIAPSSATSISTSDDNKNTQISTASLAFSSGMSAISAILLAHPNCKVLLPDDCYHGVPNLLAANLNHHGIEHEVVDMADGEQVALKLEQMVNNIMFDSSSSPNNNNNHIYNNTIIHWIETPSNPLTKITDIAKMCNIASSVESVSNGSVSIIKVVDSTWAPPTITQPLNLGADIVLHSGTKYLGGHSDVLIGAIICNIIEDKGKKLYEVLRQVQINMGAVAAPFDCWLTLRGLRSMHVRVERQCHNAIILANFLSSHPMVEKTHYPGLPEHPQHETAAKQMNNSNFGGMLSFEVSDEKFAMVVAASVKTIKRATSLGGTETLIEHRASIEPPGRVTSPAGLLRVSVGLENIDDLINDLSSALDIASGGTVE